MVETCDVTFTPQPWCGKHLNDNEPSGKAIYNYATKKDDKTPMCRIAEITRYNKLKHEYVLLDEDGPAHKKRFTVRLKICDGQVFEGSGASIKKAQQSAAAEALKQCTLPKPPEKLKKAKKDPTNFCTLLFHCANQLDVKATFKDVLLPCIGTSLLSHPPPMPFNNMQPHPGRFFVPQGPGHPFPLMRMPGPYFGACNFGPPPQMMMNCFNGPPPRPLMMAAVRNMKMPSMQYKSIVRLSDGTEHVGEAHGNKTEAKYSAAKKALHYLLPRLIELVNNMATETTNSLNGSESSESSLEEEDNKENSTQISSLVDGPENGTVNVRIKPKSVVSQVHESALRLRMNVEFEVVKESGEAHKRKYVMNCLLSAEDREPITSIGEGTSKKNAKQHACKMMLEQLKGIEADPIYLATVIFMTNKKATGVSKDPKRKTIIKDMKMDPQYGHHINPISRLVQVTQTRKMPDPVFTVVNEQGQNRYKEFTVQVCCQGVTLNGVGPNKRLAKRAAAEAMLCHIGYIKPMPQPGKSLLKKKKRSEEDQTVSIGVFDPGETVATVEESVQLVHAESNGSVLGTFADVDKSIKEAEITRENLVSPEPPPSSVPETPSSPVDEEAGKMRKRRVTFSAQVSECPPPEDSNYPEASITALKSEVVCVTKPKKRGKDSKKTLSLEDRQAVAQLCSEFLKYPLSAVERRGFASADRDYTEFSTTQNQSSAQLLSAKERLDTIATSYKFSVTYNDFPKEADEQYFSLCHLGIEKPMVQHGGGDTPEDAHNDAAFNVIYQLSTILNTTNVPI